MEGSWRVSGALVGTVAPFMVFPGYKGYPWSVTTMTVLGALAADNLAEDAPAANAMTGRGARRG